MSAEPYRCERCHAQSFIYTHRLSPGLVRALVKFKRAVMYHNRNSIHNRHDMDGREFELTKTEQANWTMLRYHALVAKDDKAGAGYWLLTARGNQFLNGLRTVPASVQVLNNRVIGHSEQSVTYRQVMNREPLFHDIGSITREAVALEAGQMGLFE